MWRILRPPNIFDRETTSQFTLHLALVVVSFAIQTNALSNLLVHFNVPGGMVRGGMGALKNRAQDKSAILGLVREMKELLGLIPDFVASKVHRANNTVVHEHAKLGSSENGHV
jgi:hypothetical protein